jgi:hypothetical protein
MMIRTHLKNVSQRRKARKEVHNLQTTDVAFFAPLREIIFEIASTRTGVSRALHIALFLLFFAATVGLNITCEPDDNPAADPACGSGSVMWDAKSQVCRDRANNRIVPNKCCGQ